MINNCSLENLMMVIPDGGTTISCPAHGSHFIRGSEIKMSQINLAKYWGFDTIIDISGSVVTNIGNK